MQSNKSSYYMLTYSWPLSDFADTLRAQLHDGELSDRIRSCEVVVLVFAGGCKLFSAQVIAGAN